MSIRTMINSRTKGGWRVMGLDELYEGPSYENKKRGSKKKKQKKSAFERRRDSVP